MASDGKYPPKWLLDQMAEQERMIRQSGLARAFEDLRNSPLIEEARRFEEQLRPLREMASAFTSQYEAALRLEEKTRMVTEASEAFSAMPPGLIENLERFEEASRYLRDTAFPTADIQARLAALAEPATALANVADVLSRGVLDELQRLELPSAEGLRHAIERMTTAAMKLGAAGWLFPREMSPREVVELADEFEGKDPADLDVWFEAYYTADGGLEFAALRKRLLGSKRLRPWRDAIRECLWAYKRGRYRVVVPTLLPVVEGLVSEATGAFGEGHVNPTKLWETRAARPADGSFIGPMWHATGAFLHKYWGRSDFADPDPGFANRHRVVHGRRPGMGDRMDALRLLAAVDFVGAAARDVERIARRLRKKNGTGVN